MAVVWMPGRRKPDEAIALDRSESWADLIYAVLTHAPDYRERIKEKIRIEEEYGALIARLERDAHAG